MIGRNIIDQHISEMQKLSYNDIVAIAANIEIETRKAEWSFLIDLLADMASLDKESSIMDIESLSTDYIEGYRKACSDALSTIGKRMDRLKQNHETK